MLCIIKWSSQKIIIVTAPSKAIDGFPLPQFQGKVIPDDRTLVPKLFLRKLVQGSGITSLLSLSLKS